MELRRYWQIILKRRVTLFKIIGIIVATVILGSFIISPVYMFSTNVWIKTSDPKTALTGLSDDLAKLSVVSSELVMYSQLAIIKNHDLLREVISRLNLKKSGNLFSSSEFLEPSALDLLVNKKGVSAGQVTSSQIIRVSGYSSSPEEAAEIANQVADGFVALHNQNIQTLAKQALEFIQDSLPKVADHLKQAEDALAEYKVTNHVNNITYFREKLLASLATLKEEKDSNDIELTGIEKRLAQLQVKLKKIPEFQKTSSEYRANPTLEYIRQKLMDAEATIAHNSIRATPEYPNQKQTQASIDKLKVEYKEQVNKLFYSQASGRNTIYTTLVQMLVENEINQAVRTTRRQVLNDQIISRHKELDDLTMKELGMGPLLRKVDALQTIMTGLLTREQSAMLATKMPLSNAMVIERASVPALTSHIKKFRWFPKRKLMTLFSLTFGLLLGMTTILVQEYMDDTLSDPGEAEDYLKIPVVASLPEFPPPETSELQNVMAFIPWAQAIWALPDLVRMVEKDSGAQVWSVTSAGPGEGKTLVAASLGWVLALRGLKVLLLDLNDLHPNLPSLWSLPSGEGLREVLHGKTALASCLRKVEPGELYLLPIGRFREIGWSQLDPKVLANFLTTVKADFDLILLDLPAVGEGEGAPLAALGEQILMVVAANHSPRTLVARALKQMQRGHGRIAGLVFNRYQQLELRPLVAQTLTAVASRPTAQRLSRFFKKHTRFGMSRKG